MSYRFITKSIHAYLIDYPVAIVLIAAQGGDGVVEGRSSSNAQGNRFNQHEQGIPDVRVLFTPY
jgi:hypothetical protein